MAFSNREVRGFRQPGSLHQFWKPKYIIYLFTILFQLIMKLFISILFTVLTGFILNANVRPASTEETKQAIHSDFIKEKPCTLTVGVHIMGRLRRVDHTSDDGCGEKLGFKCLKVKLFHEISKLNPADVDSDSEQIIFSLISNNTIKLEFFHSDRRNNTIEVESNLELPKEISGKLGKSRIELLKGIYPVTFNSNGTATTIIRINS
jgi:hypothetical protein